MINHEQEKIYLLAFLIFDYNSNNFVCELDIVSILKTWENEEFLQNLLLTDL